MMLLIYWWMGLLLSRIGLDVVAGPLDDAVDLWVDGGVTVQDWLGCP